MLQLLQEDLELEQVRVNSLTHMVVVVDESSGDSATAALESKLQVKTHTHTLSHTKVCVKHAHIAHTYKEHCENNFKTFLEFLSPLMARSPPSQSLSPSLSGGGLSRLRLLFLGENRLIGR